MKQNQIDKHLQLHGLLCHTVAFNTLPMPLKNSLSTACDIDLKDSYLSLLANAGGEFWNTMKASHSQSNNTQPSLRLNSSNSNSNSSSSNSNSNLNPDPVDNFSIKLTMQLLQKAELETNADILYPNRFPVPLMALGEYIGWSKPSPLGLGLHQEFGPWFAYRALVKTTQPLSVSSKLITSEQYTSACVTCIDTPCVNACPANAVSTTAPFNINRCADNRVTQDSSCKQQCHARNACPVGREYRYSEEQRAYHMTNALDALVKWSSG